MTVGQHVTRAPYPYFDGTQNCTGKPLNRFFPANGTHGAGVRAALDICKGCRFHQPCLDYAMDRPDLYGIWGGTTREARARIARQARKAS